MKNRKQRTTYTHRGFPLRRLEELDNAHLAVYHLLIAEGKPKHETLEVVSDLVQEKITRQQLQHTQIAC